eukprot:CAMPEP_0116156616 /NCGR_PEP_ID=MMETSP0329-20121206/22924_1 /TAXON_ID=697910 /ORGANISM="Pseudo-nitzschia arenysensis, Strain B593" /LENGTH=550 /DNA_ID=CAMNT_0003653705 /DNA_START=230 /DNA_END=1882 /DNA_ORIENTATION=-
MGNKASRPKKKSESARSLGALQDNLVRSSRHLVDYDLSGPLGTKEGFKKAEKRQFTKTQQTKGGVAIKLFNGQSTSKTDFKTEAAILGMCDHPHIIKLFEITKVNNQMSLMLELCDGGNVLSRLPYTETQAGKIVKQVCSAISYIHGKNIVHRDIDCSNIMFSSPDENSDVKLVDFGSACELETVPNHPGAFKFLREKTGTLSVMAPEVIRGKYGPKADIWSIGVVAFTLLNDGETPFKGTSKTELEMRILQGTVHYGPWKHSDASKSFCQSTIKSNDAQRISAAAALVHPWITNVAKTNMKTIPIELVTSFNFYRMALPLKRIALNVLARKVKSSKYREVFVHLNKSNTGLMTKEEFMEGFKHSGSSETELYELYEKLDINNNGGITYTEFIAATLETGGELGENQLREAFDLISSNNRYITPQDVATIVSESIKDQASVQKAEKMLKHQMRRFTKKHREEKIHYEDFSQMFEHGFQNIHHTMDNIRETSLNAEQFEHLRVREEEEKMSLSGIVEGSRTTLMSSRPSEKSIGETDTRGSVITRPSESSL